jgi:hypothetical protein
VVGEAVGTFGSVDVEHRRKNLALGVDPLAPRVG